MKILLLLSLSLFLQGCSVMTADTWSWLDEPENQKWVPVVFIADDWKLSMQVPDKRTNGIERTTFRPPLEKGATVLVVDTSEKSISESTRMAHIQWESWRGGLFKDSGVDFYVDSWIRYLPDHGGLDLDLEGRLERRVKQWETEFSDLRHSDPGVQETFFKDYEVWIYTSARGTEWIAENTPNKNRETKTIQAPLNEDLILDVGFFVNQKRYDWKDDPDWNERRWKLARKILDTVTITRAP
jgi:hypothetical protein